MSWHVVPLPPGHLLRHRVALLLGHTLALLPRHVLALLLWDAVALLARHDLALLPWNILAILPRHLLFHHDVALLLVLGVALCLLHHVALLLRHDVALLGGKASDTSVVIFGCSTAITEELTEAALEPDEREASARCSAGPPSR